MDLREAVERSEWHQVVWLVQDSDASQELRHWAIEQTAKHAPERFVRDLLDDTGEHQLDSVLSCLVARHLWRCVGHVLQRPPSDARRRWAVGQALRHADEHDFVNYVLHRCTESDLELVLQDMVSRRLWKPADGAAAAAGDMSVTDQVLCQLVSRGLWRAVGRYLRRDVSPAVRRWALEQAARRAGHGDLVLFVLPGCHGQELELVMSCLVSRGLWMSVGKVLEQGVTVTQHRWALEQAIRHAGDDDFVSYIVPECHGEELELVITHLMSRGLWRAVTKVLQRGISTEQHRWLVEHVSMHASVANFVQHILPECHGEELELAVSHLMSRDICIAQNRWAVEQASVDVSFHGVLPGYQDELEQIITRLVSQHLWKTVGKVLERGIDTAQHRWAVEQASVCASDDDFVNYILPECCTEELEQAVTRLVSRRLWRAVGKVLERGIGTAQYRWAVEESFKHASDEVIVSCVIPHCPEKELEYLIVHIVSQRKLKLLCSVFKRGINRTLLRLAVQQTITYGGEGSFLYYILPQCRDEELEHVITYLVSQGLWLSVGKVLERGISTAQHRWAVERASMYASENIFVRHIYPRCCIEEVEQAITHLVSRGLWEAVGKVLERGVSTEQRRWAVEQASLHASDAEFILYILPRCHDEELEQVITHLVSRGLWRAVGKMLVRGVSTEQCRWAVEQARMHASDAEFILYILPRCHDEELEQVITHLVSRGLWRAVGKVLERGVSTEQRRWAVEQASLHASDAEFILYILPECHEEELEQAITHLVSRGLWEAVGKVLVRGVSTEQRRWAVEQAIMHASDAEFILCILPECHEEELEHAVTHLVSRGLWRAVGKVLERGVSTEQRKWAVEQARMQASDLEFILYILPGCHDEELEQAITHLVSRGLWRAVGKVLVRGVSTEQRRWAVEQASLHASDDEFIDYILPECHDEELEQAITHLVSRGLWEAVGEVLERGVSTEQRRWAVEQASLHASDLEFILYILPGCHDEELEQVITHLVSRGLWEAVGMVLERGVSTEQRRWAVEQARMQASHDDFAYYILPECCIEEVEQAVTHLVSGGLWEAVGEVLERAVSTEQRRWAVEQASLLASDAEFILYILPRCHEEELEQAITHLVSRGLWRAVDKVLERGVSTEQCRWAVE
ncbi:uncharacterized protein LOC143289747 [Babylonia areolata]|uniref:uncharacterized protein LOC143289747 n=1 Tax=Babylonia areolata TaxID=304850 RepID=UPI003FD54A67